MSSPEKDLIRESVQEFQARLCSSVPLRHFSEHQDEAKIREMAQLESDKVMERFFRKLKSSKLSPKMKGDLLQELGSSLEKRIDEYVSSHQDSKTESETFLKYRMEVFCEDFRTSLAAKLLMNPDMDLKTVDEFFESGKLSAVDYFQKMWKHGNVAIFEDQKKLLEQKLDDLKKEMLEKQCRHLDSKEVKDAIKSLEDLKIIVLEMCGQIKYDIEAEGSDHKNILKNKTKYIHDYFITKVKNALNENEEHWKLCSQFLRILENAIGNLDKAVEDMSVEDAVGWTNGLYRQLKSSNFGKVEGALVTQRQGPSKKMEVQRTVSQIVAEEESSIVMGAEHNIDDGETKGGGQAFTVELEHPLDSMDITGIINDKVIGEAEVECLILRQLEQNVPGTPTIEIIDDSTEAVRNEKEAMDPGSVSSSDLDLPSNQNHSSEIRKKSDTSNSNPVHIQSRTGSDMKSKADLSVKTCKEGGILEAENTLENMNFTVVRTNNENDYLRNIDTDVDGTMKMKVKRGHPPDSEVQRKERVQCSSKKLKSVESQEDKAENQIVEDIDLNVPDEVGSFPLLQAIHNGESAACIKKMLDEGANVNVQTRFYNENAAHKVMYSLKCKLRSTSSALDILNLLVPRGFNLINAWSMQHTPLSRAMQVGDLHEDILTWFYVNGAYFNDIIDDGKPMEPTLFHAIAQGQRKEIIRKILEYGAEPRHVLECKWDQNALHVAAFNAHEDAIEILLEHLDVNGRDRRKLTPLNFLFSRETWDYELCLKILLQNGANFYAKCRKGYVPLVTWIKRYHMYDADTFATLISLKDVLPISAEIASVALTVMVEEAGCYEQTWNSSSPLTQFLTFLIDEKSARLRLKAESLWTRQSWEQFNEVILAREFFRYLRLRTANLMEWNADLRIKAGRLGELDIHSKSRFVNLAIETILSCLLACKPYKTFQVICELLKRFCES